ncbi:MAG: DNA topoisomerase VI subunit B [Candidatus Aenigmatarchaeota archaeon]
MVDGKTAKDMALEQREISVAEFFEKNRHLLGFDNPAKSLLTVVKEAVDNSLDACEEARILPNIKVRIEEEGKRKYKLEIEDNGPGIVKEQIPKIFGKLLYGSKFHKLLQSRGQQGIGISAAVLYSQLTRGKPVIIHSKPDDNSQTKQFYLNIDTIKNEPEIVKENTVEGDMDHTGTRIEMHIEGKYLNRYHSVDEYLQQTAIMNPYAEITYESPEGEKFEFPRAVDKLPKQPKEIKPHPHGVELGVLTRMLKNTDSRTISSFLQNEFTRVGSTSAEQIYRLSDLEKDRKPTSLKHEEQERLLEAMQKVKLMRPPTDCLSPIGNELMENGLRKEINPEFVAAVSRDPTVYRGNPFQIEAAIAYGGDLIEEKDSAVKVLRFANKVPLLYQASSCSITKAVIENNWKRYGLDQPGGNGTPKGPAMILVHMASTWVPFTSESKESIATYPTIVKEIKLAVQDCARKLQKYLRKEQKAEKENRRYKIFQNYMPLILENAKELAEYSGELDVDPILDQVIDEELVKRVEENNDNEGDEDGE